MAGGRPFINASFTECDAAIKLFSCTSVYTTCQNTSDGGGKSFNYLPFCANVTQDGIFTAARRACPCVETEDNCLLHFQVTFFNIFNRLNIDFDGKSERCQPIPKGMYANVANLYYISVCVSMYNVSYLSIAEFQFDQTMHPVID